MCRKGTLYSRCRRKAWYPTRTEARREIERLVAAGLALPGKLRAYDCACCGWHVGAVRCSQRDVVVARHVIRRGYVLLAGQPT